MTNEEKDKFVEIRKNWKSRFESNTDGQKRRNKKKLKVSRSTGLTPVPNRRNKKELKDHVRREEAT